MAISMFFKLKAQPGKRDELVDALRPVIAAVKTEPGTLQYVISTQDDEPDTVWAFEVYTDNDALTVHSTSEAMGEAIAKIGAVIGEPPEIVQATMVMGKGL